MIGYLEIMTLHGNLSMMTSILLRINMEYIVLKAGFGSDLDFFYYSDITWASPNTQIQSTTEFLGFCNLDLQTHHDGLKIWTNDDYFFMKVAHDKGIQKIDLSIVNKVKTHLRICTKRKFINTCRMPYF